MTNITDTPGDGTTVTTLVSDHDRGSLEYNHRVGAGDPFGPEGPTPTLASLAPNTGSAAGGPFTITLTGTNFTSGSVARIDGADRATTFVSATSLTVSYDPTAEGTRQFSVRNPDGQTTGNVAFTVTA